LLVLSICGYQMYKLNFVNYDDDRYAYVYAHTRRETLVLVDQIDRIANQMKTGQETGIALLSPEYWPLPWYFRNYKRVGYYQHVVPTTEPIVIAQGGVQDEEVENILGAEYQKIDSATLNDPRVDPQRSPNGSFCLRPGVNLLLYVRRDVAK
jgi:predicted membrane-bound mannosyltransferase